MLSGVVPCFEPSRLVPKALEAIAVSRSGYGPPAFAHSVTLVSHSRMSHTADTARGLPAAHLYLLLVHGSSHTAAAIAAAMSTAKQPSQQLHRQAACSSGRRSQLL